MGISVVTGCVFDTIEVRLIGGNPVIVVEAILFDKSLLSDIVGAAAKELTRTGIDVVTAEPFFDDVRDDFRRFRVVTVTGVVLGRGTLR